MHLQVWPGASVSSRQQLGCDLVPWADDAEVAAIKRRPFGGVEALGGGDHRGVNGAERQVAVLGDELCDADGIAGVQWRLTQAPMTCCR
jgi:hypothetical protein